MQEWKAKFKNLEEEKEKMYEEIVGAIKGNKRVSEYRTKHLRSMLQLWREHWEILLTKEKRFRS